MVSTWLVSDELWAVIRPLLPAAVERTVRAAGADRLALQGILFVLFTGID